MLMLTCPSCKESGRIPDKFIGVRIKCKKCNTSILVTPHGAEAVHHGASAHPKEPPSSAHSGIVVEGLDSTAWSPSSDPAVATTTADLAVEPHGEPAPAGGSALFTTDGEHHAGSKEYKLLTQKDKWFEGKFDLARLEEALNAYARQGWIVKSMATPHITGFSGGVREEFVVLLER